MTVVGKERLPSRGCDLKYIYIFLNIYIFIKNIYMCIYIL